MSSNTILHRTSTMSGGFYSLWRNVFFKLIIVGAIVTAHLDAEQKRFLRTTGKGVTDADCDRWPLGGKGSAVRAVDLDWVNDGTVEYYDLHSEDNNCCISNDQIVCTDGKGIAFGLYQEESKKYTISARTMHCMDGFIANALPLDATYRDDIVNSDALAGYITTGLYVYNEFRLNCSFSGKLPPISDSALEIYREAMARATPFEPNDDSPCQEVKYEELPFRGDETPIETKSITWVNPGTELYYGLGHKCMRCFKTKTQVICSDGATMAFGERVNAGEVYSISARTAYCVSGVMSVNETGGVVFIDDPIRSDVEEGRVTETDYPFREFGLNCTVLVKQPRRLAPSGNQCPSGTRARGATNYRQAVSGVTQDNVSHIHTHSLHTLSVSSCSPGYHSYGVQQFSRHFGYGTGELLGTMKYCEDSFSGTQNPLVRIVSNSGYTSARAFAKANFAGRVGCYMSKPDQYTASSTICEGYADISLFPTVFQNPGTPTDQFWSVC